MGAAINQSKKNTGTQSDRFLLQDEGLNNAVEIDPTVEVDKKLTIRIVGNNNKVVIGRGCKVIGYTISIRGSNNNVLIGYKCRLNGVVGCKKDGNNVTIGRFCTLVGVKIEVEYATSVTIEEDCIFSVGVGIRTGDSHSVLDMVSKERVNIPKSIFISKHCWLGLEVKVGKGVTLMPNTIVGACSYVSRSFEEGDCVIAGAPAKIVKRNTIWDRRSLPLQPNAKHIQNLIDNYAWKPL